MSYRSNSFQGSIMAYFLLVLTMLLWAGNFIVGRGIRNDVPPIALTYWRWLLAGFILLPLVWVELKSSRHHIYANWRLLLALGLTGIAAYNSILYSGLRETTAINASLMLSMTPVVIGVVSQVFLRRSGGFLQWTGTLVSLGGALVIVSRGALGNLKNMTFNKGDVWVVVAVLIWATFTVLLARRPKELSPFLTQFLITCVGVVVLTPIYIWEVSRGRVMVFNASSLLAIAYVGIFASVVAYVLWNKAVSDVGPMRAGLFLHLIPVFSAFLSVLLLDEPIHSYHVAGAFLIFTGLGIASRSNRRHKAREENQKPFSPNELRRADASTQA